MRPSITISGIAITLYCLFISCNTASSRSRVSNSDESPAQFAQSADVGSGGGNTSGSIIDWQVRADHAYFLRDGANESYLYISLKSGQPEESQSRTPLNISLVLDRSGSMAGEKIAYLRRAAKFVIDQLDSKDILSIVNYDGTVEVTSPSGPVRNKEALKAMIDRLTDRGNTNLSGGMLEGYTQVAVAKREGYVNRVLLLTDGLANEGIVDPTKIRAIVAKKFRNDGIALSTFGLGAGYNEDLLTSMAESGGANYYFIDKADRIPNIFSQELKGLLSVVAQNAVLTITLPRGVHCDKVFGYNYEERNNTISIHLNDIYARDEKGILVRLSRNAGSQPSSYSCALHYTDAATAEDVTSHKSITLYPTENSASFNKSEDPVVTEMIALFQSADEFDDIMLAADKGDYSAAKARAETTVKRLKAQQAIMPSPKLKEQEERINSYSSGIDAMPAMNQESKSIYQKGNKSSNYMFKKMKTK